MTTREVKLYGEVNEDLAAQIKADIDAMDAGDELVVRIDSPGGSVFHGFAIYEAIRKHPGPKRAVIESAAFSIASYIAMVFDDCQIAPNGYMMIHNPKATSQGDSEQLQKDASLLAKLKASMIDAYSARTGIDEETVSQMLSQETYLDAKECVSRGFASSVAPVAQKSRIRFTDSMPLNVAASLYDTTRSPNQVPTNTKGVKMPVEPTAATVKEIRAAFPNMGDGFILSCIERELPMASIASEAAGALLKENDDLKAQLESLKAEMEKASKAEAEAEANAKAEAEALEAKALAEKVEAEAKAKAEAEAKALAQGANPIAKSNEPGTPSATAKWNEIVSSFVAKGLPKDRAVVAANRENPGLRESMLAEFNAR